MYQYTEWNSKKGDFKLKPSTILQIKSRLRENLENMEDCEEEGTFNEMEMENETMSWICKAEGQKRE